MMTQTNLNGIFCIRFVTGATRTTEVHVRAAYDILCKEAETTLEMWTQSPREISMKQYPASYPSPSSQLAVVKANGSRPLWAAWQDVNLNLPSPQAVLC